MPRPRLPGSSLPGTSLSGGGGGLPGAQLPGTGFGSISGGRLPENAPISGRAGLPEFAPGENDQFKLALHHDRYVNDYANDLIRTYKIRRDVAMSAAEVAFRRKIEGLHRPHSFLSVVGKALSVPAEALSGFTKGFTGSGSASANPWDVIRAMPHQVASGYHEAGTAIHQHKMLGDYLKENNPDIGFFQNKWVGLASSTLYDPVMYLSFGATSGSKIAANAYLKRTATEAMGRAQRILKENDGYFFGKKYNDPVELMQAIRKTDGMPLDLPSALDHLKGVGQQYKGSMRQLKPFDYPNPKTGLMEQVKPTPGRVLGSLLLPTGVKGGRGIRFAGMEIPGTGDLTAAAARGLRGKTQDLSGVGRSPLAGAVVHGFMTNPQLRLAGEDTIRAIALGEMTEFKAELQGARLTAKEEARNIARGGTGKYIAPAERAGAHTVEPPIIKSVAEEQAGLSDLAKNVLDTMPVGHPARDVVLEGANRRAIDRLTAEPHIQAITSQVRDRVGQEIAHAKKLKIPERETRDLWKTISAQTDDPIEAIGMFTFQNQVKVRSREFIQRLLDNPLFAMKIGKDDMVPMGYVHFTDPVSRQRYAVLEDMSHALEDLVNPQFLDRSTKKVMDALSMPQNYWKQFATSANPSFHVMNFLGAVWNNLYAGIYNPGDYLRAITTLYRSRMEEAVQSGRSRYMGREAVSTPKTQEAAGLAREARVRGATSETASIFAEIQQGLTHGVESFVPTVPATVETRLRDLVARRPNESRRRYALRQTRRGTAAGLLATGNPVGVALLAPEAARTGRIIGTTIEDVVRLAPFMKASHDPVLLRYMDAFGPIRVPGMKHPGFSKAEQSAMYDIGANLSKHFQFDYSDLTDFERKWAKLIFPFYTFYRKNFVLQMQLLAEAPRGLHGAQSVMNYLNENGDVSDAMQQLLPEYFDQISAFQIPVPQGMRKRIGLPLDQPLFLNPKLPFMSLNLMPDLWDVFRDTGQPTPQKVLAAFAPMLGSIGPFAPLPIPGMKPMLEAATGMQLGLNKTIDYQRSSSNDWRNSYVPAPSWVTFLPKPVRDFMGIFPWMKTVQSGKPGGGLLMTATGQYVLDQISTPFVTNLGQAIPTGGADPGKAKADLVSWMTGIRLIPVDTLRMHRSWAYRLKSMLEARQQDLKDQGKQLEPQDAETLSIVRQQVKMLEAAWDLKQEELHPTSG
jgi:hypothetical protein